MRGFTLGELLVVVGIITVLVSIGGYAGLSIMRRAQATSILNDFRLIEGAWEQWRADARHPYPKEDDAYTAPDYEANTDPTYCNDDPFIINTNIFRNIDVPPGALPNDFWNGPYLSKEPFDPWDRRYMYDNDPDTYNPNSGGVGNRERGVNIILSWCPAQNSRYAPLASILDRSIDGVVDQNRGKFRWVMTGTNPRFIYLLNQDGSTY